jgi:hypothetical protein
MCPFCLATVGFVVAGAVSTGALTTLAVKVSRKKDAAETIPDRNERSHVSAPNRSREVVSGFEKASLRNLTVCIQRRRRKDGD